MIVVFMLLFATSTASAQDEIEARRLFERSAAAFEGGRFEDALEGFQECYALSSRPELLYNIAISFDRLRRDREAIAAFRRYLDAVPDTDARSEIEARIAELERHAFWWQRRTTVDLGATEAAPVEEAVEPAAPSALAIFPAEPEPSSTPPFLVLGLAAGGLAVASLAATIGFRVAANGAYEDLGRMCASGCTPEVVNVSSVPMLDAATSAFLVSTIVFAATSAILLALHIRERSR